MTRKASVWMFAALALIALGAYAYYANRGVLPDLGGVLERIGVTGAGAGTEAPRAAAKAGGVQGEFAVPVEAERVGRATVQEDLTAIGTLRSNESVVVRPEIAGRIVGIHFTEGERVERGVILFSLDSSTQAAEVAQAQAQLALNDANYRRALELQKKNFISDRARDEALAVLKVAQSSVDLLEARLAKTRIIAPFAGMIGIRQVSVGDYVKEGQDLVVLEDLSLLKVDFRVPESVSGRLRLGQQLELNAEALAGRVFHATVVAIDPLVDPNGRALLLRGRLDDSQALLRPGMFARVRIVLAERKNALMVPEQALMPVGNEQYVYRIVDGKAQRAKVKTGVRRDALVEVLEGLASGDTVVSAGQLRLRDGARVRTGAPAGAAPAKAAVPAPG